jgi:primosomal protein N' (replication factor Y)
MAPALTNSLFDTSENQPSCGKIVAVAFDSGVDNVFDYLLPDKLGVVLPGQRLEAPFGRANKLSSGFCVEVKDNQSGKEPKRKLKYIKKVIDAEPLLDAKSLEFGKWLSDFYVCPLGQVLGAMIPAAVKKGTGEKQIKHIFLAERQEYNLRGKKQKQIVEALKNANAFDAASAVDLKSLLEQLDIGN